MVGLICSANESDSGAYPPRASLLSHFLLLAAAAASAGDDDGFWRIMVMLVTPNGQ